jgi:CRISPR-associated endonuclease/helicase Cas3
MVNVQRIQTRIYAKSADETGYREPLAEHTINDIKAGRQLVANLPFGQARKKQIGRDLDLCLAFHDLGKAATGFQFSLEKEAPYWGHRHEILSAAAAAFAGADDSIVFAVLTHHKTLPSDGITIHGCLPFAELPYKDHIAYQGWQDMSMQWYDNIDVLIGEWRQICEYVGRLDLLAKGLGLTPLSENMNRWLERDSQTEDFPFKQREYISLLRGLTISADHIASAGSYMPVNIPQLGAFNVSPTKPYGFQIRAARTKGNLILRAPTGSGKTEAALLWAQLNQAKNGRLFYALPTTASINAMYLRIKRLFNDTDNRLVGLLHSRTISSLYSMFEGDNSMASQKAARTIGSLVREMYFPFRVCTPHQILRYSLQGKGWEAMLSEFQHSVFVFDEIHAYNPKLTGLTIATVKYLTQHNATCMFLTATLPTFLRKLIRHEFSFGEISLIQPSYHNESDKKILEQKRHTVEAVQGNILTNIDMIAREAEKAHSTLVVCNHVPTAQRVYRLLWNRIKDRVLLHSQFARRDRNNIENELLRSKRPKDDNLYKPLPKILVSTQVVEVSLDLDFQLGFSEPAAIDALVQRMGRINRYAAQRQPAKVRIFEEQFSSDNTVYSKELRDKSLAVLISMSMPLSEEELNHAADMVYGNGYNLDDRADYEDGLNYERLKYWKRYLVAGTDQDWIEQVIDEKEGTVELLPDSLVGEYRILNQQGLTIEANDLLVPVGRWRLPYLFNENKIDNSQDPWILDGCRYSREIGLEV